MQGDKTLSQLGLVPGRVISVRSNVSIREAFEAIIGNDITGLAVVDDKGKLVGNLSATDFEVIYNRLRLTLQGVTEMNFMNIELPVSDILKRKHGLSVTRTTTFAATVALLQQHKVHRVYIVDDHQSPIGIVSITDIMKILAKELHL